MDHEAAQALFSDFVDGTLDHAQRLALEAHLAGCAACGDDLASFRSTIGAMRASRVAASPAFLDELRSRIRTRSRGRFFGERRPTHTLEVASLVTLVVAVAVYVVLRFAQPLLLPP